MFSLEEQIANYADVHFNAEHNAQYFFSTNAETEVTRQLNELAGIQSQIETVLREKVRANYTIFLDASEGIQNVGNDMISLKELIVKTQALVENIRKNRFAPGNNKRSGNSLPKLGTLSVRSATSIRAGANSNGDDKSDKDDLSSVPAWVMRAPEDLSRYIIEQRFSQAASLAVKAKAFVASVKDIIDLSPKSVMADVVKKVEEREKLLASTILKSLSKLPNSQLWGAEEQQSRLKLLISLKQYELASDGFVQCNIEVIPRTLRNVEASGETLEYIMEISRAFFVALTTACKSFLDLLHAPSDIPSLTAAVSPNPTPARRRGSSMAAGSSPMNVPAQTNPPPVEMPIEDTEALKTMMSMLVHWGHLQMELFVAAFSRQVQVGASDKCGAVIEHYRMVCDNLGMMQHQAATLSSPASLGSNSELSRGMGRDATPVRRSIFGPLTFVANCLHVAHEDAVGIMDSQLHMQGAASLSWLLLPDIRKWVHVFADEIVKEIYVQIRQEEWFPIIDVNLELTVPTIEAPEANKPVDVSVGITIDVGDSNAIVPRPVALSYAWLVMILDNFTSESWILLNFSRVVAAAVERAKQSRSHGEADRGAPAPSAYLRPVSPHQGSSQNSGSSEPTSSYSRADLSEIEPGMVSCILRIIVNFIKNVEKVDIMSLTNAQRECFIATLDRLVDSLIPSALRVINTSFYYEGLKTSPQDICDLLIECIGNLKTRKQKPERQFSRPKGLSGGTPQDRSRGPIDGESSSDDDYS